MNEKPVILGFFNEKLFSESLSKTLGYTLGKYSVHEFPDAEILIKIATPVKDKSVIVIASLDRPNNKMAQLIFAAETLKELGANKITLVAPYLAYMRQDKQFHEGEGITSKYFAKLLSTYFDRLVTIDPHLHRWHSLNDIFNIPTTLLHATIPIAEWINKNVSQPVLVGPDKESTQWVKEIAARCNIPYLIVEKTRASDTNVSATIPHLELYSNHTPVLIDDIISTGMTLQETIKNIKAYSNKSIVCIGVHAVFAGNAYQALLQTGIKDIVTCNTIAHPTNQIDISDLIISALK